MSADVLIRLRVDGAPTTAKGVQAVGDALEQAGVQARGAGTAFGAAGVSAVQLKERLQLGTISAKEYDVQMQRLHQSQQAAAASAQKQATEVEALRQRFDPAFVAAKRLEQEHIDIKRALDAGAISQQRYTELMHLSAQASRGAGVSMGQLNMATRQLPLQMQDVIVSLQAGQNPMQVLLQQGSQIAGSFGGVGVAIRSTAAYLAGFVTPLSVTAAGLGTVALAAYAGSREMDAYRTALTNTGYAAGVTAGQLDGMARSINAAGGGTQGAAAEALAELVGNGRVAREVLQGAASATLAYAKASGQGLGEISKAFADLAKDPLQASLRLNDGLNYLTTSTYQQIRALEEQGRKTEAAAVAQKAYADMMQERAPELLAQMGFIERGWGAIASAAKGAWDAIKDIGREESAEQRLAALDVVITNTRAKLAQIGDDSAFAPALKQSLQALLEQQSVLQSTSRELARGVDLRQQQAAQVKAQASWQEIVKANLSDAAKLEQDITRARNAGAAAGATQQQIEAVVAQIRKRAAKDTKDYSEAALAGLIAENAERTRYLAALEQSGAAADKVLASETRVVRIQQELAGKLNASQRAVKEKELAEAQAIAVTDRKIEAEKLRIALEKEGLEANAKASDAAYEAANAAEKQLQAQLDSNVAIGLGKVELAAHKRAIDVDRAAMLERRADVLASMGGQEEMVASLRREAKALRELADARTEGARKQEGVDALKDANKAGDDQARRLADAASQAQNFGAGLRDAFATAGDGLARMVDGMLALTQSGKAYAKEMEVIAQLRATGDDGALAKAAQNELALIERTRSQQVGAYAAMAGAAKTYFKEGSKGYAVMGAAEKALRTYQLIMSAQTMTKELAAVGARVAAWVTGNSTVAASSVAASGVAASAALVEGQAKAVAGVAGQASGDPYTAFPRMAAMAAIMAGLGFAIGGISGSGGGAGSTNTGTGTVLGDSNAQSESLANSLEMLGNLQDKALTYSMQMAASLRSIDSKMGGLAVQVLRANIGGDLAKGIKTGYQDTSLSILMTALSGGNVIGRLGQKLFGKKTTITGQGFGADAQSLGDIFSSGFDGYAYADVQTKRKFLGVTTSKRTSERRSDLDSGVEQQIGQIFQGIGDSVISATEALGGDVAATQAKLESYVVQLGRVDLKGLTGEQISERLSAVFGAEADKIAAYVMPGFEQLQQVGEGYYETMIRVASQFEVVSVYMNRLGDELGAVGVEGAIAADALVQAFGGLEQTQSALSAYYEAFYSESERQAMATQEMTDALGALGFSMPTSIEAFRELVNAQDLTTEAGRAAYAALINLAPGFADLINDIADETEQAAEEAKRQAEQLAEAWRGLGDSMLDEVSRIRGVTASAQGQGYNYAAAEFASKTALARAGDQDAAKALPALLRAMLDAASAEGMSQLDYLRIAGRGAASLEETAALVGGGVPQLETDKPMLPGVPGVDTVGRPIYMPTIATADLGVALYGRAETDQQMALQKQVDDLVAAVRSLSADVRATGEAMVMQQVKANNLWDGVTQGGTTIRTKEVA
jgi:hypothetical protein